MAAARWLKICALIAVGGVAGAAAIIASTAINRVTSTDALCTSCHSMAILADDPRYKQSRHEVNAAGIRVGCSDCHIRTGNWFVETYEHVSQGLKDVVVESTHNYADPVLWEKRRPKLATDVRAWMRGNDSATCRKCHDAAAIRPSSEAGRSAHAALGSGGATCIDCHSNIVHTPARAAP